MVIPSHTQWRVVDFATERWAATTILDRPEFGAKVKFAVRERASLEARTAWLATDPPISDGDYLLETLAIAQHPRGGSAPIHVLGNRPSLVVPILEFELHPLYPAAARHTRSLEEHALLLELLCQLDDDSHLRTWATDMFRSRTDVSWLLRNRARAMVSSESNSSRPDIDTIAAAWDAIGFTEAGGPSAALAMVPVDVGKTRRAAAVVLAAEHLLPEAVVETARSTARRIIAAKLTADATSQAAEIATYPLDGVLEGERAPAAQTTPSIPPQRRPQPVEPDIVTTTRTYRATPDGTVIDITDS